MPSDCQCSSACHTEIRHKVIGNKEAGRKIDRLEAEIEELQGENARLKRLLREAKKSKKDIVAELKRKLDGI